MTRTFHFSSIISFTSVVSIALMLCILLSGCNTKEEDLENVKQITTNTRPVSETIKIDNLDDETALHIPLDSPLETDIVRVDVDNITDKSYQDELVIRASEILSSYVNGTELSDEELHIITQAAFYCDVETASEMVYPFSQAIGLSNKKEALLQVSFFKTFLERFKDNPEYNTGFVNYYACACTSPPALHGLDSENKKRVLEQCNIYLKECALTHSRDGTVTGTDESSTLYYIAKVNLLLKKYDYAINFCEEALGKALPNDECIVIELNRIMTYIKKVKRKNENKSNNTP